MLLNDPVIYCCSLPRKTGLLLQVWLDRKRNSRVYMSHLEHHARLIRYMNIPIKMNKDFERALSTIDAKYGEDFEILNLF